MERKLISVNYFNADTLKLINDGLLLTAGDFTAKAFNAMTISWGSIGIMWGIPFAQVVVRPTRYTYEFMEKYPTFTITGFSAQYQETLALMGTKSGRDLDKIKEAGLNPIGSTMIEAPGYREAELIIECKKIYFHDFNPANFLVDFINPQYHGDYHRSYFGQILAIHGTSKYSG